MATAQDYPVTFPFGATSSPYSETNKHKGDDRAMPTGTPVVVNGCVIGLSGNTGTSTGSHLHIGRWVNGQPTNPQHAGFSFNQAIVTQVANDATNGNYVRVQADGASWVYLHMSQQLAHVGQVLVAPHVTTPQGEPPVIIQNADNWFNRCNKTMYQIRGRALGRDEFEKYAVGAEFMKWVESVEDNPEADAATRAQEVGQVATRDNWEQQIQTLQARLQDTDSQLQAALVDASAKTATIADLTSKLNTPATKPEVAAPAVLPAKPVATVSPAQPQTPPVNFFVKLVAALLK